MMKNRNIAIVLTVRAKSKKEAIRKITNLMNNATCNLDTQDDFSEWGYWDEYKDVGEKVIKR